MWVCPMESYKVYTTGSDYMITKIILITKSRSQVSICPHIVNITSPAWSKLRSTRVRNTSLDSMGFSTNDSSWIESWVFVARDDCSIISLLFHVPLCPCCIQASNLNLLISFHGVPFARLWKGSFFECHFCHQVAFSNGLHPNNRPQLTCLACTPPPHLQAQGTLLARRDAISCMDGLWEQGLLVFEISNFETWKPGFWKVHLQLVRSLLQIGSNSYIFKYVWIGWMVNGVNGVNMCKWYWMTNLKTLFQGHFWLLPRAHRVRTRRALPARCKCYRQGHLQKPAQCGTNVMPKYTKWI